MKRFIAFIISISPSICSCQQVASRRYEFKVEIKDDSGGPVENASVTASKDVLRTTHPIPVSEPVRFTEKTNHKGVVILVFDSVHQPGGVLVEKPGYYLSTAHAIWNSRDRGLWTADVAAILKPVKNPIPMVYHVACGLPLGEVGKEYFFDMEVGEALPPIGRGKIPDLSVVMQETKNANGVIREGYRTLVRFNNPLDGVIEFESQPRDGAIGSTLVSGYLAPEAGYAPALERMIGVNAGRTAEEWRYFHSLNRIGYYFRVRTKTNETGQIISAHYGKIYGAVEMIAAADIGRPAVAAPGKIGLSFSEVYFNLTSNDRNVECDTKTNLSEKRDASGKPFQIFRP